MTTLYICRGIPGSGKSTMARKIAEEECADHFEADMFFLTPKGDYQFDSQKLHRAHQWCQDSTRDSLLSGRSVVVSNTFTTLKELRYYFDLSYDILNKSPTVYVAEGNYKNVHGVPWEVIQKMRDRFVWDLSPLHR